MVGAIAPTYLKRVMHFREYYTISYFLLDFQVILCPEYNFYLKLTKYKIFVYLLNVPNIFKQELLSHLIWVLI